MARRAVTLSPGDLALYGGAMLILFLTPGPVWVPLIAVGLVIAVT